MPTEGELATCAECGYPIVWEFDEEGSPHGFWYDAAAMTEACGGRTGDPVDDLWHRPA